MVWLNPTWRDRNADRARRFVDFTAKAGFQSMRRGGVGLPDRNEIVMEAPNLSTRMICRLVKS